MTEQQQQEQEKVIYYFGFGPIVNELVRKRRGIEVIEVQAAYVPDYRLTFAFGGIANIVAKKGFEVHGLLMKLKSHEDWKKLRDFEAGNTPTIRTVMPYSAVDDSGSISEDGDGFHRNADDDFRTASLKGSIQAYLIEHPDNVDDTLLDAPIECLPQERYLKLIAQGLRQHNVDEEFVADQIEAFPFIPTRKEKEYFVFPTARRVRKISWGKYERLCERGNVEGDIYFCLGNGVFRLGEHDPANPMAKWLETHGHGQEDCTFMINMTVVEPSIPYLEDESGVTPLHIAWAENHLVEIVEQYGMTATRVYELTKKSSGNKKGLLSITSSKTALVDATEGSQESLQLSIEGRSCCSWFMKLVRGRDVTDGDPYHMRGSAVSMRSSTKTAIVP